MSNNTRKNEIQSVEECDKHRYKCIATCYAIQWGETDNKIIVIKTNETIKVLKNSYNGYIELVQKESPIGGITYNYERLYDMPYEQFKACFKKIESEEE